MGDPEDLVHESTDEILLYSECFKNENDSDPERHLFSICEIISKEADEKTALMAFYDAVIILENKIKVPEWLNWKLK